MKKKTKKTKKTKGENRSKHVQRLMSKKDSTTYPWQKSFVESITEKKFNKIRVCPKPKKIELASQDKYTFLQPYIDKILKALGHSDALVTDESYVTDFLDVFATVAEKEKMLKKLSKKLKVEVSVRDYVWQVAERMKNGKANS